jgi:hypothetical protein
MPNGFMGDAGPPMRIDRDALTPRGNIGQIGPLGGRGMPRPPPQPMRDFGAGGGGAGGLFGVGAGQLPGPKPPSMPGGMVSRMGGNRPNAGGAMGNIGMGMGRVSMDLDNDPQGHYRESRSRRDDRSRRYRPSIA